MKRIFLAGIFAIGVFGAFGLVLSGLVRFKNPINWREASSSLRQLDQYIYSVVESEGSRPKSERVNRVIEAAFETTADEGLDVDEGHPDFHLYRMGRGVSGNSNFRAWGSPPVFVEMDDVPNGFGFYLKGSDGISKSGGMDEDDLNSWGKRTGSFYEDRFRMKVMLKLGLMAAVPTLIAFVFLLRLLRRKEIEGRLFMWVKAAFLFIGIPMGLLLLPAFVFVFALFGFPWESTGDSYPSWRSELPPTATGVYEDASGETIIGEYSYRLRAKVTKEEFGIFCKNLDLTPHLEGREYSSSEFWMSWNGFPKGCGGWWIPTDSLDEVFVWEREERNTWSFAKYEDGYLYFRSFDR